MVSAERQRLDEADRAGIGWRRWGPYLSERQWGTVREDASHGGDAWSSFTHDQARYRAYRTGSDQQMNLMQVAQEISNRLVATFLKDADGHRPVHGGQPILQNDPHWQDLPLISEYCFHGDDGAGIGASHQTGWTGIVGVLPLLFHGDVGSWVRARGQAARREAGAVS